LTENVNDDNQRIKSLVLKIILEKKPETIRQLISLVKKEVAIPDERLLFIIQELEDEKHLQFGELIFPESTAEYIFSFRAVWYWIILLLSLLTAFFVFTIPDNLVPQIYARSVLGILFVLFFPGYTLIKAIFPISVPLEMRSKMLDNIERIALSIGLSLAVAPFIGLILYFMPWGLNLALITLSLLAVTTVFSTLAVYREYHARKAIFLKRLIVVTEYQLTDNAVKFFDVEGLLKKRLILIKQIPINEITSLESFGNELSITSNGVTNLFLMKYNSQTVSELCKKIRSMQ
jgi:hypothetical protein